MIEINKAYVINLSHRTDRWEEIQKKFANTGIELIRWDAVYGKQLDEEIIKYMTTPFCYKFCSYSMIGCWLSHLTLWHHIVENNETNVLILEDDAVPVDNFNQLFNEIHPHVPSDWDFLYLGCNGPCDNFAINTKNMNIKIVNKINDKYAITVPSNFFGLHAYLLTNNGAQKLINDPNINNASYHIDVYLSMIKFPKGDIKVYAILPSLIHYSLSQSDNVSNNHPIITNSSLLKKIYVTNDNSIDYTINVEIGTIRKSNISITILTLIIFLLSIIIGLINNKKTTYIYIVSIGILFILELNNTTSNNCNFNTIVFDYIVLLTGTLCGILINDFLYFKFSQ